MTTRHKFPPLVYTPDHLQECFDSPSSLPTGSIVVVTFSNRPLGPRIPRRMPEQPASRDVEYLQVRKLKSGGRTGSKIQWVNMATGVLMKGDWLNDMPQHKQFIGWKVKRIGWKVKRKGKK